MKKAGYCWKQDKSERILTESKCSKRCEKRSGGRRCLDVDEESRKVIMEQFWQMMDWKEKMVYVLSLVNKQNVTCRTKTNRPEDNCTYIYHLQSQR